MINVSKRCLRRFEISQKIPTFASKEGRVSLAVSKTRERNQDFFSYPRKNVLLTTENKVFIVRFEYS